MAISEQAKEITNNIYSAYGSGTGILFGIPAAFRGGVETIVQAAIGTSIKCPFCGEDDFDLVGLKHHLSDHCQTYQDTEDLC